MINLSLIPPQAIRNHLANNSPSKVAHQFSKTKRFNQPNPQYFMRQCRCPHVFYTFESQLSKRRAVVGTGKRSDFTKDLSGSPGSTAYNKKSQFEEKNVGQTFGVSRDRSPDRSYLIPQIHANPGIGKYENQIKTRMHQSYTIRSRTIDVVQKHRSNKYNPGPADYNSIQLEPNGGRFRISKYSDTKFAKINPKTKRFKTIEVTPGPLSYQEKDSLNSNSRYLLSQRKGQGTRVFDVEKRFTVDHWRPNANPGPGDYEKPSQFGVYGDAKYYKTTQGFTSK